MIVNLKCSLVPCMSGFDLNVIDVSGAELLVLFSLWHSIDKVSFLFGL